MNDLINIHTSSNNYQSPLKITLWQLHKRKDCYHFLIEMFIELQLTAS